MLPLSKRRRKAVAALATAGIAASLCLQALVPSPNLSEWGGGGTRGASSAYYDDYGGDDAQDEEEEEEEEFMDEEEAIMVEEDGRSSRRGLLTTFGQGSYVEEDDYNAAFEAAFSSSSDPGENNDAAAAAAAAPPIARPPVVQPYTLEDALFEAQIWAYTFAIVVYDPPKDKFVVLYSRDHKWKAGNKKLFKSIREFTYLLRKLFPERFTPDSPEFVVALGSGDYPHVQRRKLPHSENAIAPVLMFGSAFRDPSVYPNMIPMPMPMGHMPCYLDWVVKGMGGMYGSEYMQDVEVCDALRPVPWEEKEFGGLRWEDLTPQLIWRGTDFSYLPTLQPRPSLIHPDAHNFVPTDDMAEGCDKRAMAIRALNEAYDTLIPRWKAVALAAAAELEVEEGTIEEDDKKLPWADIRFSSYLSAGKSATVGAPKYGLWESVGMATGTGIGQTELAQYKYHIDLGGGGGTTWSGTTDKLAMPGLLFHHITPMKDYYHDRLVPWRHYVPVTEDLRDLRRKFDWAESHPEQAKRISDAGTEFMRHLGTPEGFEQLFKEDFVEPLRRVIEAYRPVSIVRDGDASVSWMDALESMPDCRVLPVMECTGLSPERSCILVGGEEVLKFQQNGRYNVS